MKGQPCYREDCVTAGHPAVSITGRAMNKTGLWRSGGFRRRSQRWVLGLGKNVYIHIAVWVKSKESGHEKLDVGLEPAHCPGLPLAGSYGCPQWPRPASPGTQATPISCPHLPAEWVGGRRKWKVFKGKLVGWGVWKNRGVWSPMEQNTNPDFATCQLYDLGQVTLIFWASVPSFGK